MTLATDDLGPHLLGRIESLPDPRDFPLGAFLRQGGSDPLDAALAAVLGSWEGKKTKALLKLIVARIEGLDPAPPAPGPAPTPAPTVDAWVDADDPVLDQGQTPRCVGWTGADWKNALPVDDHVGDAEGARIYDLCKRIDGDMQDGSTIRSLAQALQQDGQLDVYAFASTIEEVNTFLELHGPICWGIGWTDSMFRPDETGLVVPTGSDVGGHAIIQYRKFDPNTGRGRFRNHWGTGWGPLGGDFDMTIDDAAGRLAAGGEAMAGVEIGSSGGHA